ncbi:MAG: hypothetical protein LBE36_02290 [Flavobacteriaceae bacterium]|jgi:hypothetical protein|nr:hypothetical protein [Flavobacteriaceae bacterium]
MNKLCIGIATLFCGFTFAQEFLQPSDTFSHKAIAYITLAGGKELQGTITDIDRKKGLIEEIVIKDGKGKKQTLKPEQIHHMYLMPNLLSKANNSVEALKEANNYTDKRLNNALLGKGYVYFENVPVMVKKKRMNMLMQLVNPDFCSKIKVYHDPRARETTSLGIGPLSVAGGIDKSYYVSKNGEVAYKFEKSDYKDSFIPMFQSCSALMEKYKNDIAWRDFEKHVYEYTTECN